MMEDEGARLLDLLHAHGQQFLNSFDLSQPHQKRQRLEGSLEELENEDFEEWRGFSNAAVSTYLSEENNDGLWSSRRLYIHYNGYIVRYSL
jgi:hypothetical protein